MVSSDDMKGIMTDVHNVYGFLIGSRPQDRAHDYLKERHVSRGSDDTAIEVVAGDLVKRAYKAGMRASGNEACALPSTGLLLTLSDKSALPVFATSSAEMARYIKGLNDLCGISVERCGVADAVNEQNGSE